MESILYDSVTLSNSAMCTRFLRAIDARPAAFFAANVKSLCIPGDIDPLGANHILVACQGVVNLAYWITYDNPSSFHLITSLRPKRLSINTRGLFGSSAPVHFGQPFFANVTHLELVDWPWMTYSNLELLPSLTHLAVDLDLFDDRIIRRLHDILDSCRLLLVLLCLVPNDDVMVKATASLAELNDSRIVVLSDADVLEDWEASLINLETCQWAFAEGIVNEKRGKIIRSLFPAS